MAWSISSSTKLRYATVLLMLMAYAARRLHYRAYRLQQKDVLLQSRHQNARIDLGVIERQVVQGRVDIVMPQRPLGFSQIALSVPKTRSYDNS